MLIVRSPKSKFKHIIINQISFTDILNSMECVIVPQMKTNHRLSSSHAVYLFSGNQVLMWSKSEELYEQYIL